MMGYLIPPQVNEIFVSDKENQDDNKVNEKEKQKEKGEIDVVNCCLTAKIANFKQEGDDDDMGVEGTKIHVQLYWDEQMNATLVQFNVIEQMQDKVAKGTEDFDQKQASLAKWDRLRNTFIDKAAHVLTGLPKDKLTMNQNVNQDIKALYAKCFPPKKHKKKRYRSL